MGVNGGVELSTDGQPSPVYLGRSYGITLQRQVDILLTKQTTDVLHASSPLVFLPSDLHACALSCIGTQIRKVVFAYLGLKEVFSACVKR